MCFTVITSVYKKDQAEYVQQAFDSIYLNQTRKPSEIIVVVDGPVSNAIYALLEEYVQHYPEVFQIIKLPENKGLGNALKIGVDRASNSIVARMDSDDISVSDRFEKQLVFLGAHPECDIVGGQITEFIDNPNNIVAKREVPCTNEDIYKYMRSRCALNHPTVMFKKESVLKAGNYIDWFWNEDYYMWVRMMEQGCIFANLPEVLVNMRSGLEQYGRRGGKKYFDSEIGIKKLMLNKGMITRKEYIINYVERFIVQLMLPNSVRGWVFRTFARK